MIQDNQPLIPEIGVLALTYHRWGGIWMTPHHVLSRLARYFHVVWVNPAHGWRDVLKKPEGQALEYTDTGRRDGFTVYTPEFWLPKLYRPEWLARLTFDHRLKRARRSLNRRGIQKLILYLWHPQFGHSLTSVPFDLSCYHIDDEYSFSDVDLPLEETEVQLMTAVDQVFITSLALLEKKGAINPHTSFAPEGVDYQAYANSVPEPSDLASIRHPRIGYTGWLKKQLDWSLLLHLTEQHPEWSFVFVGPQKNSHYEIVAPIKALYSRRNVHFLGSKTVEELASYPQHFDVCIMPYVINDYTKYIYPLKLHEYLASGQPTVGTPIRSLQAFADVVALAKTPDEWSAALELALRPASKTAQKVAGRRSVARRYDWELLIAEIARAMARRLDQHFSERLEKEIGTEGFHPSDFRSVKFLGDDRLPPFTS